MWFSFWRARDRFSLDELRYLTEQLQKIQSVNEINKGFVIEALRSIAELVTYGDQHDPSFFEFFMEKQVMAEFVRILKISRVANVALQLLQTMSIMIQNLKTEHAIYYIFSNEHINILISYSFDFQNEELLSYYISFLRAISGKLNRNTISLLVKTKDDEVVSFPLYVEAIRFAFHEDSMVRIAVRALTLNVYHVGDAQVNKYISSAPLSDFFSKLVSFFQKQCINLDKYAAIAVENPESSDAISCILTAVDEIEDNLYYFSDIVSAGVPELGKLITDNILHLLVFPLLLPSLKEEGDDLQIGATTSMYLLCCILHIVKTKDLGSSIATALFCLPEWFAPKSEIKLNGCISDNCFSDGCEKLDSHSPVTVIEGRKETSGSPEQDLTPHLLSSYCPCSTSRLSLREILLSFIISGNDTKVLGSLSLLATLLQTKELDESMLDGFGILPQRKQHKKLLLQALVGEGLGEEQLFFSGNNSTRDGINTELDQYLHNFKVQYGFKFCCGESGIKHQIHRHQVLDALVGLFCRPNISAEVLWAGGWLLRQLLPHSEAEFNSNHLKALKETHKYSTTALFEEIKGSWCDLLLIVLMDEWRNCKKAIESSSPQKDMKRILLPVHKISNTGESSFAAGERMCEILKVFVLRHQLLVFSSGGNLTDLPPPPSPTTVFLNSRAKAAGLDLLIPKPGTEINLVDAVPCRIAFERGRERHFCFLAISRGTSGWVLLAEELPLKQHYGVVRVAAPLGGSNPKIDDKHPRWLHLRIRPSTLPFVDPSKLDSSGKVKAKVLVDGRWTLAFRDESTCQLAESMIREEMHLQSAEVEKRLKTLLNLD